MTKISSSTSYSASYSITERNGTERKVQAVGGSPSAANVSIKQEAIKPEPKQPKQPKLDSGLFVQPRAYPSFSCCLQSVNCLSPHEFTQKVRRTIAQYPHLRKRISLLLAWEAANTCSNMDIANKLLDEYLAHRLDSKQLLMLDEIINLTL